MRGGTAPAAIGGITPGRRRAGSALLGGALLVALATAAGRKQSLVGLVSPNDGVELARSGASAVADAGEVPIPVEGAAVRRGDLALSIEAAGEVAARRRATLRAPVGGRVIWAVGREGQRVRRGAPLVRLDSAEFELAAVEARARLERARAAYRELTVLDEAVVELDARVARERAARAKSGAGEAEVAVLRAALDLERTRVVAPFGGRVADIRVVTGQSVRPGDELLTIVDAGALRVETRVLEEDVGAIAVGGPGRVSVAALGAGGVDGRVLSVNPLVDSSTRTARVTVAISGSDGRILPGMYARVALETRRLADRVVVPRSAVLERDGRTMVFVYAVDRGGARAKWRYVTTGLANDSLVEVMQASGADSLAPGDIVLTGGHETLIHDARVRLSGVLEGATLRGRAP